QSRTLARAASSGARGRAKQEEVPGWLPGHFLGEVWLLRLADLQAEDQGAVEGVVGAARLAEVVVDACLGERAEVLGEGEVDAHHATGVEAGLGDVVEDRELVADTGRGV